VEIDELKSAWRILDQKLSQESAIHLALYREQKLGQTRSILQRLRGGQVIQLLAGIGILVFAGLLWSTRPAALSVILAGVAVHLYGIACVISAGVVMNAIHRIDYSDSVLEIQNRLARIQRAYVFAGVVAGLPWWFMWVPFLMVLAKLGGVNLYSHAPSMVWIGLGVGSLGMLATLWLYSYSRDASRPRLNRWVNNAIIARSLREAQAQLEEIRRFTQD